MNTQVPTMHSNPRVNTYLLADEQWTAHAQDLWKYSSDSDFTVKCSDLYTARCDAEAQLSVVERHMLGLIPSDFGRMLAAYGNARSYYEGMSDDFFMHFDNKVFVAEFAKRAGALHLASLPLFELGLSASDLDQLFSLPHDDVAESVMKRYYVLTDMNDASHEIEPVSADERCDRDCLRV